MLAIAAGGVLGATLRWLISSSGERSESDWFEYEPNIAESVERITNFPYRTLTVNVLGCLFLGAFAFLLARATEPGDRRLFLGAATGFCGSLTTFSTFAFEIAEKFRGPTIHRQPEGILLAAFEREVGPPVVYLMASVLLGGLAFWCGRLLAHRFVAQP